MWFMGYLSATPDLLRLGQSDWYSGGQATDAAEVRPHIFHGDLVMK